MRYCPLALIAGLSLLYPQGSKAHCTPSCAQYQGDIKSLLSTNATVQCGEEDARWSEYGAPNPGGIITVGVEDDVAKVVSYAVKRGITFLVQSGANGWADTFTLGSDGIVIDISQLKAVSFNSDLTQVTFQAGNTNSDIVDAAWANNAYVATATCNCVSLLGATLGGGLIRTSGVYGLAIDQLLSLNYVDPDGNQKTVTETSDPDLWWALTGAGANFGIVTSAVAKSVALAQADNTAWTGTLIFNDSMIESVISAINNTILQADTQLDFYFAVSDGTPTFIVLPFYLGGEDEGREIFSWLFDLGPIVDGTAIVSYNEWNSAGDSFCTKGGRNPAYHAAINNLDPAVWRNIWDSYVDFVTAYPEANQTTFLTECYSVDGVAQETGTSTSYAWRDVRCYAIAIPWYSNPSFDKVANEWGQGIREQWFASSGTPSSAA